MEEVICKKCGLSKVVYRVEGEDLWAAETHNCKKIRDKSIGEERYICNNCGNVIDRNDMYMMVDFGH